MPTFLATKKMAPELRARLEASVRGASRSTGEASHPGRTRLLASFARIFLVVFLVLGARSFMSFRKAQVSELERSRSALSNVVRAHSAELSEAEKNVVARVSPWLVEASSGYAGDVVDDELRKSGFGAWLSRPTVYVRGPIAAFGAPKTLAEAAAASRKDPLLVCLVEPPRTRDEKNVLDKVRAVYMGGAETRTPNVRLLHEAIVGLPFLARSWETNVAAAKDARELVRLRADLEKAPIEGAKRAARAELLVYAMDEPGRGTGPSELDGERVHDVRVGLVELASGKVLLRVKRTVDPSWMSSTARVVYASGMDACLLATEVRTAAEAPK
jgi:hypothetical protein